MRVTPSIFMLFIIKLTGCMTLSGTLFVARVRTVCPKSQYR
jgi:hypothetical protein